MHSFSVLFTFCMFIQIDFFGYSIKFRKRSTVDYNLVIVRTSLEEQVTEDRSSAEGLEDELELIFVIELTYHILSCSITFFVLVSHVFMYYKYAMYFTIGLQMKSYFLLRFILSSTFKLF